MFKGDAFKGDEFKGDEFKGRRKKIETLDALKSNQPTLSLPRTMSTHKYNTRFQAKQIQANKIATPSKPRATQQVPAAPIKARVEKTIVPVVITPTLPFEEAEKRVLELDVAVKAFQNTLWGLYRSNSKEWRVAFDNEPVVKMWRAALKDAIDSLNALLNTKYQGKHSPEWYKDFDTYEVVHIWRGDFFNRTCASSGW